MAHHLNIDIETRSSVDIGKAGMYRYAQSEDFRILLFAYRMDNGESEVVDLACGEQLPGDIRAALCDPGVIKHAYNAAFEWYCLNRAGYGTPIAQWRCTMVHGLYCGYTAGLEATGKAIGLPQDKRKLTVGKALIRYFCTPCKPTKSNGGRRWNEPKHAPEKWALFKEYNRQDVVAEGEILKRLSLFPVPEEEEKLWQMDVKMNAFGVRADRELVTGALAVNGTSEKLLFEEACTLTGLENPNSAAQLLRWLEAQETQLPNLQKDTVTDVMAREGLPGRVRRVLEIRQQLGKTSVKKYAAMLAAAGNDGRIRGLTQFYGANRTGRWSGRLV